MFQELERISVCKKNAKNVRFVLKSCTFRFRDYKMERFIRTECFLYETGKAIRKTNKFKICIYKKEQIPDLTKGPASRL